MSKSKVVRIGFMGSAAALALLGTTIAAQAVETRFGDVSIVFDTTVSAGVSVRTADRESRFLPQVNGGTEVDTRVPYNYDPVGFGTFPGLPDLTPLPFTGSTSTATLASATNAAGSINSDDGRLNFDAGDLTGATFKASHDLQATWRNYTFFVRWFEFYDPVLNGNPGERSDFSDDVRGTVGKDAKLLDAFVSANFDLGGLPVNLRAGKQVISWGEGTFILNGINVVNPIDVTAFRRPGAEIKEGLVPVNSIFVSSGTPIDGLSLSGFYMLDFEQFEIDAAGTPFSNIDGIGKTNLDPNGSIYNFVSGNRFSGSFRRNCSVAGSGSRQLAGFVGQGGPYDALVRANCATPFVDYLAAIPVGQGEFVKNTLDDQSIVTETPEREARDDGQFGLRANYYDDGLGVEFSAYYMNYHSRLPFAGFRAGKPVVGIDTVLPDSSASSRAVLPAGCLWSAANAATVLGSQFTVIPPQDGYATTLNDDALYITGAAQRALTETTLIDDPNNYEGLMAGIVAALAGGDAADIIGDAATSGNLRADLHNLARINCLLALVNTTTSVPGAPPHLFDGAETLGNDAQVDIYFEYPEDIDLYGFSLNGTLWGWGIQFEASYRPNAPFQIDTDELYIASVFTQCGSYAIGSAGFFFQLLQTSKQYNCPYDNLVDSDIGNEGEVTAQPGEMDLQGYFRNEMYTAQFGTTATFTGSEWMVEAVGADLGILVTEIGMVYVPGVEDTYIDALASPTLARTQYQNVGCQLSDLPLGGFVDLSAGRSESCRPKDFSAGMVLLYRLDYNNAFNSGWALSPQIAYSWDFEGTTPAPYGNFMEDRQSANLSVTGTLNNNLRLGIGYTAFWGGHIYNKAKDQDFASVTASYTF